MLDHVERKDQVEASVRLGQVCVAADSLLVTATRAGQIELRARDVEAMDLCTRLLLEEEQQVPRSAAHVGDRPGALGLRTDQSEHAPEEPSAGGEESVSASGPQPGGVLQGVVLETGRRLVHSKDLPPNDR